jgi:alpha-tubulin suppressor-like RCC1 family protein
MPYEPITNFKDSDGVDLGKKLVTKDYLLEVYGTILENSPASGLIVTPELWTWGNNSGSILGINNSDTKNTPVTTFTGGTNWKQVSAGSGQSAAIKTDGSLWVWGTGSSGQLGNNATTGRATPVTTFAGGNDWKQVACGETHTAAIKTDGSLWTWGAGTSGELGNFNNTNRTTPVTTFAGGNTWKQVSAGRGHTAAIKTDGSLWVWGNASIGGKLGTNDTTNRSTPVTTFAGGNTWKQVSCGGFNTAAVKTDGSLWTWGNNNNSQLGINASGDRNTPVTTFAGGTTWKQVACSLDHTAAIKTDGTLWTWGSNTSYPRLGTNDTTHRSTPVTTFAGGNNWKQVSCNGGDITAAIKTDGTLWTWGRGNEGALGNFAFTDRSTPVTTFAGGNNWKQVSAGPNRVTAIQTIDYI